VTLPDIDIVVTAMVGYAGLLPTIRAIEAKKTIALANKETLVVAGDLITRLAVEHRVPIIPVDSEHSAIFQCLVGEGDNPIEKIILTASGGPFRCHTQEQLLKVTRADALRHPNWKMGNKITIDSATLMNKGFEMIEAKWLFGVTPSQIEVVVHPQSIVHSMVEFADGAVKAQLGTPDMKLPIRYALSYPNRLVSTDRKLSLTDYASLTFERPDMLRFPLLQYAFDAVEKGGNMPCIMNAANEIAVAAFLNDRIGFCQIAETVAHAMNRVDFVASPLLDDYIATNREARDCAARYIETLK
ncbi:MAG: 1-deoxy-D-xylulose-5-phosphate reductoisomerase, partial [Muribaculaceae bacterium]|nr:1-deoxy-D-xylulose-5-phosphate reductoisomerase [Muribaculaceae bacterium]